MPGLPLEISCHDAHRLRETDDRLLLLDCREPHEHAVTRIEGAQFVPMSTIVDRLSELQGRQGDRIIVLCHAGVRSLQVAQWLRHNGFASAQSLTGGIDQWAIEIDPEVPRY